MPNSRLNRIDEKRTKRRLYLSILAIIIILLVIFSFGIPVLVRVSSLLGTINSDNSPTQQDKTAPFAPTLSPVVTATNSAQLKIEGYSEPESTLTLMVNDEEVKKVLLGADGGFSFPDIELKSGENHIYTTATDAAGNESTHSHELVVSFKKGAPKLTVTEPEDNKSFGKDQQQITVSGTTDKGNDLSINDRFVYVKDDGLFTYQMKLADGENKIVIIATDPAKNETKIERTVTFTP